MLKKLITTSIIFFICLTFLNPIIVKADDWNLQLTDPKDSPIKPDIKAIYMKEDNNYLYVKFEGHNNWSFTSSESMALYVNTQGDNDISNSRYFLMIILIEGTFLGAWADMQTDDMLPCSVDFAKNSNIGTANIPKNYANNKFKSFSFLAIIGSLDYEDFFVDLAPDSGLMKKYERGPSNAPPKLEVSPESIDLGAIKVGERLTSEFEVSNNGGGTLNVNISASINAIIVNPQQFNLSEYESKIVNIGIETRNLSPGEYSENLTINSNGGDKVINISFEVLKEPKLYFKPDKVDFGEILKGEKRSENIKIGNVNKGPIKVKISSDQDWLVVSKKSFESEEEEIKITVITSKIEPGEHNGEIRISSDGGNGKIQVSFTVVDALSISETNIDFGKVFSNKLEVQPKTINLKNNSKEQSISVKIKTDSNWIKLNKSMIELNPQREDQLEVSIDFNEIKSTYKKYTGTITLTYGKENTELKVLVIVEIVEALPELSFKIKNNLDKIEGIITIGEKFEDKITIKNVGGGTLKVNASVKDSDLPIKLNKYSINLKQNETEEIILSLDSEKINPGKIETFLILDSNGGKAEIPLSIAVKPKPEIRIKLYIGNVIAFIGDDSFTLEAPPYIVNGTTFVPLRFISEAFGSKVEWQNVGKGRIIITLKEKIIILNIGSKEATINGTSYTLLAPPEIKNGRTFVPVRFISEGLGAEVLWNAQYQEVTIIYKP